MKNQKNKSILSIPIIFIFLLALSFNLSAQTWEQLNNSPLTGDHCNGYGLDGKAYIVDSENGANVSSGLWEYTAETDTWVRLKDFPGQSRTLAAGDDWNGKYYYGFGRRGNQFFTDLWVFDPVDTSFTQLPSCPGSPKAHPAFIAHNDKIFVGAGSISSGNSRDWWEYDMITEQWSQKPNVPGDRRHHPFYFSIDDDIYVGGGHVFNWGRYNPVTEQWTAIDNFPEGRVAGTQFSHGGYGYVLAGDDYLHVHVPVWQTFLRYNAQENEWEELPPLPNGSRWAPASFVIDDVVYFFGGLSDNIPGDASMWKFDLMSLDTPTSTEDLTNELQVPIEAFPNPFQDKVQIKGQVDLDQKYTIRVLDIQGRNVLTMDNFDLRNDINLASISVGIYFLEISNKNYLETIKLVKSK